MKAPREQFAINVQAYINRIRNKDKRRYAQDYWRYLQGKGKSPKASTYNVSCMALQGVRLQLENFKEGTCHSR